MRLITAVQKVPLKGHSELEKQTIRNNLLTIWVDGIHDADLLPAAFLSSSRISGAVYVCGGSGEALL